MLLESASFGFPPEVVVVFVGAVALSIFVDLFLHRDHREISVRDAALWSIFWIGLAGAFYLYLRERFTSEAASLFLAGYALEKTLSVDNLMVFVAIFRYFRIQSALQHRILYWGILGALVFRLIFVAAGSVLLVLGPYADLLFAAIVGWSAWKMATTGGNEDGTEDDYSAHPVVLWAGKVFKTTTQLHGMRFFVHGAATPALVCLLVIEASDIMFAFDSVPAVVAVTREPLLVYAAMIFAILGLRSLYFVLLVLTKYLIHLEKAVIALLAFIAVKLLMQATNHLLHWPGAEISPAASLGVILGVLGGGVLASLVWPARTVEVAGGGRGKAR